MDILLVAGLWLDGSAWDDVASALTPLGHRPVPLTLPGQGDGSTSATLDDQVAAVLAAVDSASGKPMVVGHSAACTLAWLAADARPEQVAKVALIGGFPSADGASYADFFELTDGVMPFPGWGPFEGPDSADLDEAARRSIAAAAIPVPAGVAKGPSRHRDGPGTAPAMTAVTTLWTAPASGGVAVRSANSRWPAPIRVGASVSTSASAARRPSSRSLVR